MKAHNPKSMIRTLIMGQSQCDPKHAQYEQHNQLRFDDSALDSLRQERAQVTGRQLLAIGYTGK